MLVSLARGFFSKPIALTVAIPFWLKIRLLMLLIRLIERMIYQIHLQRTYILLCFPSVSMLLAFFCRSPRKSDYKVVAAQMDATWSLSGDDDTYISTSPDSIAAFSALHRWFSGTRESNRTVPPVPLIDTNKQCHDCSWPESRWSTLRCSHRIVRATQKMEIMSNYHYSCWGTECDDVQITQTHPRSQQTKGQS
jgi:hypothetical protein